MFMNQSCTNWGYQEELSSTARPIKWPLMSALGQKRTFSKVCAMSALPPKADIAGRHLDVRFVPIVLQKSVEALPGQ
jgi:hypothetical protein